MLDHLSNEEFLDRLNREFEQSFTIAVRTCKDMDCNDMSEYAAKKVFSYNPNSSIIQQYFPKYTSAIGEISKIVDNNGQLLKENIGLIKSWIILGHCYLTLGDFPNAFASYAHALRANAHLTDYHFSYGLSLVYFHFNYPENSIQLLKPLIAHTPQLPYFGDMAFRAGVICRTRQQYSSSIYYFEQILDTPPNNLKQEDIQFQIAYTYQVNQQPERAGEIYAQLVEKKPKSIRLLHHYSQYLLCQSNFDLSKKIAEEGLKLDPVDPVFNLILGRIAFRSKNFQASIDYYKKCINYWTDVAQFWCELAVLYHQEQMLDDAMQVLNRALYYDPQHQTAWRNIIVLKIQRSGIYEARPLIDKALNTIQSSSFQQQIKLVDTMTNALQWEPFEMNIDFVREPEAFARQYMGSSPIFPGECYGENGRSFPELANYPKSLFE
ncbi:TPR Domain containing protein [Trichomonas vaginalis G3]|uniref:TPR Domain containing protein n=1 Tax=Trichomonas vaginalis (strain ATCC PRA-98 / G3) TaxID=412133 RepID=A2E455_TRIV3|nr:cellular component assembly [Trichomonas vaginalis G3]EAY12598.1 TPR Domain containing protein [Trichomonas vaginalis G3]KAI5509373.1 cellular component assembly [Trichomonas vaginalis G3]|eukprot:XP_001324821.1 TPR Domain containing protein [Trichomonas vaginalis G3]